MPLASVLQLGGALLCSSSSCSTPGVQQQRWEQLSDAGAVGVTSGAWSRVTQAEGAAATSGRRGRAILVSDAYVSWPHSRRVCSGRACGSALQSIFAERVAEQSL